MYVGDHGTGGYGGTNDQRLHDGADEVIATRQPTPPVASDVEATPIAHYHQFEAGNYQQDLITRPGAKDGVAWYVTPDAIGIRPPTQRRRW